MLKRSQRTAFLPGLLLCALLLLVTACSARPVGGSGGTPTPGATASGGTPGTSTPSQTVQMPPTQTSCPAADTARAAVMRPLALGHDQDLVYIYNEVPQNTTTSAGHLRRFDATTGQKTDIVTSGLRIDQAQVSADGQWVLFLSIPDPRGDSQHSAMLQLVRMDGQGLQTLYCFPNATYSGHSATNKLPISLQWSIDERSILFSVNTNNANSQVELLNVATGALSTLFQDQNDSLYYYSVVTWLDNTHFYLIKQGSSGPTPPATLFLLNASTATPTNPGLVQIMTTNTRMSYFSFDSSYDATQLYSSYCLQAASPFNTNIAVGPAQGGARHTIFQEQPADCIQTLRAVLPNTLLLLLQVSNSTTNGISNQVWMMSLPGGSMRTLATLTSFPGNQTNYAMNETSQFPWSNLSRNNNAYALQTVNPATQVQSILVGSLSGGSPNAIATTSPGLSTVSLAGWTTL